METLERNPATEVSPARIMEIGMGFWASKTVLTAIKLNLFTELADGPLRADELQARLQLHSRSSLDFFDTLVALGFLRREGLGWTARYSPTDETGLFLNRHSPAYIGGLLEMANDRLYPFWGSLEEALRTGQPQNEVKLTGKPVFEAIYANPAVLQQFLNGMAGAQAGNFSALAEAFDFERYRSLCDIGGANGLLSITVAQQHPHLRLLSVDLPPVEPIAQKMIDQFDLGHQIQTGSLDFLTQDFPKAEVITMGNILHDWDLEHKKMLIRKAYAALPANGALVVIENVIDDERRYNAFGLLMSLNMLIETNGGFDYTHADFHGWAMEAGFQTTAKLPLSGPSSALVAYK